MTSTRDASNALILQDAYLYVAPKGTTLPDDVSTDLIADFKDAGWLDPDGVTTTPQGNVTELKGVTGATLAYIKDGDGYQFTCNCLESNDTTASLLSPNSTKTVVGGVTKRVVKASVAPEQQVFVIEKWYTNGSKERDVIALGSAVVGAVKDVYTAFRSFPLTISAVQQSDAELFFTLSEDDDSSSSSSS